MEAKELRIGNYLNDAKGKLAIVEEIQKDNYKAYSGMVTSLPLEPIQLTHEWLLKFGFNQLDESQFYKKQTSEKYYLLTSHHQGYTEICVNSICGGQAVTKYVHQLQNLFFSLTGKELIVSV